MEVLSVMKYGGIVILVLLLTTFEIKYRRGATSSNVYTYYTPNNCIVKIRHIFGYRYKVYVNGSCPVDIKQDRFGSYFILVARSAADAEFQIDEMYRC